MWARLAKMMAFIYDETIWRQTYTLVIEIEIDTTFLKGNFGTFKKVSKYMYALWHSNITSTNLFYKIIRK